jgi:hypothetical protein
MFVCMFLYYEYLLCVVFNYVFRALQLLRSGSVSDVVAQANASKGKETASRRELPKVVAKRPPITDTSYLIDTVSEQRGLHDYLRAFCISFH